MNAKTYRRYIFFFLPLPVFMLTVIFFVAIWIEPFSGDLTRLGGFPENWYGWEAFQSKLPRTLHSVEKYDSYYDVVVLGDSFSYRKVGQQSRQGSFWQDFLINKTGLSVIVFDANRTKADDIINSSVYKSHPPKIFIYENIERDLVYIPSNMELEYEKGSCEVMSLPRIRASHIAELNLQLESYKRGKNYNKNIVIESEDKKVHFTDKFNQASNVVKKRLLDQLLGLNLTKVRKFKLTDNELFSNHLSNHLLVYENDLFKKHWDKNQIANVRCYLVNLQNKIQKSGETFFIFMAVPDKLTVYQDYIVNAGEYNGISKLSLFRTPGFHFISLLDPIKIAVNKGKKDIYLPNDTHWGSAGHEIVSDYLINYLYNNNLLIARNASG